MINPMIFSGFPISVSVSQAGFSEGIQVTRVNIICIWNVNFSITLS
jgi:hypothetical protein